MRARLAEALPSVFGEDRQRDSDCNESNSIISCHDRSLAEEFALPGTGFILRYDSSRVVGPPIARSVQFELPAEIDEEVIRIDVEVFSSGQRWIQGYQPIPGQLVALTWNGLDAYARNPAGEVQVGFRVGYVYPVISRPSRGFSESRFGQSGSRDDSFEVNRLGSEITLWSPRQVLKSPRPDARIWGLGGWTIASHHSLVGDTVFRGDGAVQSADDVSHSMRVFAGFGAVETCGSRNRETPDNPLEAVFCGVSSVGVADDGTVVVADDGRYGGTPTIKWFYTDGRMASRIVAAGRATSVSDILVIPQGTIASGHTDRGYYTTLHSNDANHTISFYNADHDFFRAAHGLAVDAHGQIYGRDTSRSIHRLDPGTQFFGDSSRVTGFLPRIVAGNAENTVVPFTGLGDDALNVSLSLALAMDFGPDGSLYFISHNRRVLRLTPDGLLWTVAGSGSIGSSEPRGPALDASLSSPQGIAVRPDGGFFLADTNNAQIRYVSPSGTITTVIDDGLIAPTDLALDQDGRLFIVDPPAEVVYVLELSRSFTSEGVTRVPDRSGAVVYDFDPVGRHLATRSTVTGLALLEFHYDVDGHLTGITDREGLETQFDRSEEGVVRVIGPYGHTTSLEIDEYGYLSSAIGPDTESYEFTYDGVSGLLTSVTTPRSRLVEEETEHTYDEDGKLVSDQNLLGGEYTLEEEAGNVTLTTAMGVETVYVSEGADQFGTEQNAVTAGHGLSSTVEQSLDGSVTRTYPNGVSVTIQAGSDPRFGASVPTLESLEIRLPSGLTARGSQSIEATLADPNDPLSLIDYTRTDTLNEANRTTSYTAENRTAIAASAAGRTSTFVFDEQGRMTRRQFAELLPTIYTYDSDGRLESVRRGEGDEERSVQYEYGEDGFVAAATNNIGQRTTYEWDSSVRAVRVVHPGSRETSFSYDEDGNLVDMVLPHTETHGFDHNLIGLLTGYSAPTVEGEEPTNSTTAYDLDKRLDFVTLPDGTIVDTQYDEAGRIDAVLAGGYGVSLAYSETTGDLSEVATLDGERLSIVSDGPLLTSLSWDGTVSGSLNYTYNSDFRPLTVTVGSQPAIVYGYDLDGFITTAGEAVLTRDDDTGQLEQVRIGTHTTVLGRNDFGEVVTAVHSAGDTELLAFTYTADRIGRISAVEERTAEHTRLFEYGYNESGELARLSVDGAIAQEYSYDSNGNRLTVTWAEETVETCQFDEQDRLKECGGTAFEFDDNGQLSARIDPAENRTEFFYDPFGQLRQVDLPSGVRLSYAIDPSGRRIGRSVDGVFERGWIYGDSLHPIAEFDASGQIQSIFVFGSSSRSPDYMERAGRRYRFLLDHVGSVRLVVDIETGDVVQRLAYDPWGRVVEDSNPGFQPFGFAGGLYDPGTGLVRFGARDYDATVGRWTAKDPIGFAAGDTNLYAYAFNDPVNLADTNGLLLDIFVDVASILYDSYRILKDNVFGDCGNLGENLFALSADVASAFVPLAAGGGAAVRHGDEAAAGVSRAVNGGANGSGAARQVEVPRNRYPEGVQHIEDAQAAGHPSRLTIDRPNTRSNRRASQAGHNRVDGMDLDEYPPAMFSEGGAGASIRPMTPSQNRGMGACIGNQCRGLSNGSLVDIIIVD